VSQVAARQVVVTSVRSRFFAIFAASQQPFAHETQVPSMGLAKVRQLFSVLVLQSAKAKQNPNYANYRQQS
jgi:hypothetical protein